MKSVEAAKRLIPERLAENCSISSVFPKPIQRLPLSSNPFFRKSVKEFDDLLESVILSARQRHRTHLRAVSGTLDGMIE